MEHQRQYAGIDLHRRRSVIVRRSEAGETRETVRIDNDPITLAAELAKAGEAPEVVLEACYGWVRHEAPRDRVGCKDPPAACRSRPLKLEAEAVKANETGFVQTFCISASEVVPLRVEVCGDGPPPDACRVVRGHEKVLACGHFEVLADGQQDVPAGGHVEIPTPR